MKILIRLSIVALFLFSTSSEAQTLSVGEILDKMNGAVSNFEQGQFTIHDEVTTFGTDKDTTRSEHSSVFFFEKNTDDSLIGYKTASLRENDIQIIYNGVELLTLYNKKLEVILGKDFPDKIKEQFNSTNNPLYFTNTNRFIQYNDKRPTEQQLRIIGVESFLGEKCYKLRSVDSSGLKRRTEQQYYVSITSFLPIRTVTKMSLRIGNADETTIYDYSISDIKNEPIDTNHFSRGALSEYEIEKIYSAEEEKARDALLLLGTKAPDWKLPLITGGTMSLSDLKGKIVVMDFWFKSCAPCIRQMLDLEKLHKKYPAEQVVVIGVNTYDDPEKDKLDSFLKNRMITMESVYKGGSITSLYNVYGSPSLFIINQKGEIVFTKAGNTANFLDEVEKAIDSQLR